MALVTGGEGGDRLQGTGGIDRLTGLGGDDVLAGGDGSDLIEGGAGNDLVYGWGAADGALDSGVIRAVRVANGLAQPVFAASPPGEPDRLFVLEKDTGRIQAVNLLDGGVSTFLDIPDAQFSRGGERGALGLAFHPDYAANGRFFVFLTTPAGDLQIREYARGVGGAANPEAVRSILTIPHPEFSNHNGGWIAFGPDGMLYAATGDGGGGGDPNNNAQNVDSLLGKILRLDVNGDAFPNDAGRNYAIPAGNPFAAGPGADEVWHYGLRNPFRASFDRVTGDLLIGDVGQSAREEINIARAGTGGLNFGWRLREGALPFNPDTAAGPGPLVGPVLDYGRAPGPFGGVSVTGGVVNRGPGGAQGLYVFGDFGSGAFWTARIENGAAEDFLNRNGQLRIDFGTLNQPAAFVEDGRGRLCVIGLDGEVHRLDFSEGAGDGGDTLDGGDGDDRIFGGAGDDVIVGGEGSDTLQGGLGRDRLFGGAGADLVGGGADGDNLDGGEGDDFMGGEDGDDVVQGGAGTDVLFGDAGADLIGGGVGNDRLFGQDGDDFMGGEAGDDLLDGGAGVDVLFGDAGADVLLGGAGNDRVFGQEGADALLGQEGADFLDGGGGDDRLDGGPGDDVVLGGAGADTAVLDLVSGGADRLDLGDGADVVLVSAGGRIRQVRLTFDGGVVGDGTGTGGGDPAVAVQGEDLLPDSLVGPVSRADDEGVAYVANGVTFDVRDAAGVSRGDQFSVVQLGSAGADTLNGVPGVVVLPVVPFLPLYINGGRGDDRIFGGSGADLLLGGTGDDLVDAGVGNDRLELGDGADFAGGQDGDDVLEGGAGMDVLFGDAGDDILSGGAENDFLYGGTGLDVLRGGENSDYLDGNAGDDVLEGGWGFDDLRGGAGADRFVYRAVSDAAQFPVIAAAENVLDFRLREGDRIDVSAIDADLQQAGDQAFTLVTAFTGARGQALISTLADGRSLLLLDADGDRVAEFALGIFGDPLTAEGLVL